MSVRSEAWFGHADLNGFTIFTVVTVPAGRTLLAKTLITTSTAPITISAQWLITDPSTSSPAQADPLAAIPAFSSKRAEGLWVVRPGGSLVLFANHDTDGELRGYVAGSLLVGEPS